MTTTRAHLNPHNPHARALRRALADAAVSNAELARRLGRPGKAGESWVRRRTHGQTPPRAEDLAAIAAALGCPVANLMPPDPGTLADRWAHASTREAFHVTAKPEPVPDGPVLET